MDEFLRPYAIIFGTAAILFASWWLLRTTIVAVVRRIVVAVTNQTRRRDPPATVAPGANAWSCGRCRSVNRPDAVVCYSCRGERAVVEHLQGHI